LEDQAVAESSRQGSQSCWVPSPACSEARHYTTLPIALWKMRGTKGQFLLMVTLSTLREESTSNSTCSPHNLWGQSLGSHTLGSQEGRERYFSTCLIDTRLFHTSNHILPSHKHNAPLINLIFTDKGKKLWNSETSIRTHALLKVSFVWLQNHELSSLHQWCSVLDGENTP
jgi:hypothetical protein